MPRGRPSIYSQELADRICERLASGESLRSICGDDGMPSWPTISKWLNEKPDFVTQYARAREDQAEAHADRIIEIADDETIDANHKRIMVDARSWRRGALWRRAASVSPWRGTAGPARTTSPCTGRLCLP
jgi:hypothetical protein